MQHLPSNYLLIWFILFKTMRLNESNDYMLDWNIHVLLKLGVQNLLIFLTEENVLKLEKSSEAIYTPFDSRFQLFLQISLCLGMYWSLLCSLTIDTFTLQESGAIEVAREQKQHVSEQVF